MNLIYCFSNDYVSNAHSDDDILLQAKLASMIGRYVAYEHDRDEFRDAQNVPVSVDGKRLFVRSDYGYYNELVNAAVRHGAIVLETSAQISTIENWFSYYQPKRFYKQISVDEVLSGKLPSNIKQHLLKNRELFIKSKSKGFHQTISADLILAPDARAQAVLQGLRSHGTQELLISDDIEIERDQQGNIEVRCIVIDGKLRNVSRFFHSIPHVVSSEIRHAATEIVEALSRSSFPLNYALDVATIKCEASKYIDIIEINPISTSMCYINNSIFFEDTLPGNDNEFGFGMEFYNDYCVHPDKYVLTPIEGQCYSFCDGTPHPF